MFSAALAVGSLMTSGEDLIDALCAGPGALSTSEVVFGFVAAAGIVYFVVTGRNSLIALVSSDIARTAGIDVGRLNLIYLLMCPLTIALRLRYLGVLLMSALIIISAAAATRPARNLNEMLFGASLRPHPRASTYVVTPVTRQR